MTMVNVTVQGAVAAVFTWDGQVKDLANNGAGWVVTFNEPNPGFHVFTINLIAPPGTTWSGSVVSTVDAATPAPAGTTNAEGHGRSVGGLQC